MQYRFAPSRSRSSGGPFPDSSPRVQSLSRFVFLSLSFAMAAIFVVVPPVEARPADATEYQVKAAYLFNFGKFVAWPEAADERASRSFAICVLGEDPFGPALDSAVAGATIRWKRRGGEKDRQGGRDRWLPDYLISSSEMERLPQVLAALDKTSVLAVSDIPRFHSAWRNYPVRFRPEQDPVRNQRNERRRCRIVLSSELLKVAVRVTRTPRRGN